ncbi:MAG: DUF6805 domain-containing protein, partial [Paludibacter sp.]
ARTIDRVAPGEQQPEVDHSLQSLNSNTGNYQNEFWRDANNGGFISYKMRTNKEPVVSLMVRYWGYESGNRTFDILINGVKLITENIVGKWNKSAFFNVEYPIPDRLINNLDTITVRFQASGTNYAGGLFYVRILRPLSATALVTNKANDTKHTVIGRDKNIIVSGITNKSTISVYDTCGHILKTIITNEPIAIIPIESAGVNIVKINTENETYVHKVILK